MFLSLILANLETYFILEKFPAGWGSKFWSPQQGHRKATLTYSVAWPPAQVQRHRNNMVSLREEELQLYNHWVPSHKHLRGNSCREHLAELEYGLSFLQM